MLQNNASKMSGIKLAIKIHKADIQLDKPKPTGACFASELHFLARKFVVIKREIS